MILRILAMMLLPTLLTSCYTLEQAYHFNNAFNRRVKIDTALAANDLDPDTRSKLALSKLVINFAKSEGLNTGGAYQHYIPAKSSQVSYYVQAALPDRLESKTWWFPIVGSVPYLGYFDRERRDSKAAQLKAQGLDVSTGSVGAFSSLGWFEDPIYASMLKRSDVDFIQMMLHELVHRSYWSRGSVPFNENLAEFLADVLTERFILKFQNGKGLEELRNRRENLKVLGSWLEEFKAELAELYQRQDIDVTIKLSEKSMVIEKFKGPRFPKLQNDSYTFWQHRDWNNASLLGASLYNPDTDMFQKGSECLGRNFMAGDFLSLLENAESRGHKAEEGLKLMCRTAGATIATTKP